MHVVLSLDPGGTERLVIEIAKSLAPAVASIVCCLDQCGEWASELTSLGVPVVALNRQPGFRPSLGRQIAALAGAHRVDALHCHHYSPFIYGQIARVVRPNLRIVFTEHGRYSDAGPSLKRRLVNPVLNRLPAAIYAVSSDLRRHMIAEGLPERRVQVIHNGIDPGVPPSPADGIAARQSLGMAGSDVIVGTAGRFDPVKGLPALVEAFAALRTSRPHARLVIIGDGPERARVIERATALDVLSDVRLTGYRRDVRQLMAAIDIYVNSSEQEGVSLTILEAMASRRPVVATAVGGTPEVVVDRQTGLLVPPRSPRSLAAALDTLVDDPQRRQTMGEAGRSRVERHFSLQAMTASYLRSYRGNPVIH